jgi:hypothetical protein
MKLSHLFKSIFVLFVLIVGLSPIAAGQEAKKPKTKKPLPTGTPILWRDPGDISKRDMQWGPGAADIAPVAPFTFVKEDPTGASPKFSVKDARGVNWNVKFGVEAQSETVATRLVWAMGYFAEEAYYLERAEITNLPRLSRGNEFVSGSVVRGARFEPRRKGVTRGAIWD